MHFSLQFEGTLYCDDQTIQLIKGYHELMKSK